MTKQIENHGLAKFKANIQKASRSVFDAHSCLIELFQSREGVASVLRLLRESRLQPMTLGGPSAFAPVSDADQQWPHVFDESKQNLSGDGRTGAVSSFPGAWAKVKSWVFRG